MALDPVVAAEALDAATQRPATLDFFFESLSSPEWIDPLCERELFDKPPEQRIDEEGLVRAPSWAQSRYLARVASLDSSRVLEVIRSIETNNERIVEDFVDAALAMPVDAAAQMTPFLTRFVNTQLHLYYLLPRKLTELIVHFARGQAAREAVSLMRALFKPESAGSQEYWRPRTKPRFSEWEYDMHLRKIVAEAMSHAPEPLVTTLVRLLEEALELIRADSADPNSDGSRAWRVRVGDDRGRGTDLEDSLTAAVRDAALAARQATLLDDAVIIDVLTRFEGELYRRIAMFVLAHGPDPDAAIARQFALDVSELTHYEPSPEYQALLKRIAPSLSEDEIAPLLDAIRQGPDVDGYRLRAEEYGGVAPSDEDSARYVARWQIGRLELLAEALPADAGETYERLLATYGPAGLPLSWEITTFTGPSSPVTVEELTAKTDDELLAFLRDWTPSESARGGEPSIEGLARAFSTLAEAEPERIAGLAPRMRDLKPGFSQWMLHGFEQAVTAGRRFEWAPLLELLAWIAEQPRAVEGGRGDAYADLDPGWVWTRRAMAGLLERGVSADEPTRVPYEERERAWRIIEQLTRDPEPTPEDETRNGGANFDPVTLALNTTRPRATRAAIAYAVWVYQQTQETDQSGGGGFLVEEVPEVARVLADRLDLDTDQSASVRAVIGQFFANLFALDRRWAEENVAVVFPNDDTPQREAAWGAYVIYTRPYDNVFKHLRPAYERSTELAGGTGHGFRWMNDDPVSRLGEHLLAFYWRGLIEIDDPLLANYWENALTAARTNMVESAGRWARDAPPTTEAVVRLQRLWTFIKGRVREGDDQAELAGFAWWFVADGVPLDWRIDEMQQLVDRGVRPDLGGLIAEELPQLAVEQPTKIMRLLRALIEAEEDWFPYSWRDQIERVLRIGYRSTDEPTRTLAYETVNLLLEKGLQQYAVVLEEPVPGR